MNTPAANGSGDTRHAPVRGPDLETDAGDVGATESVAGEEDPGASIDMAVPHGTPPTHPGDEAVPGTPGTGEAVCARCGGTGRIDEGPCPECGGTGKVIRGIGGA